MPEQSTGESLHLSLDPTGRLKMGTCEHCVLEEMGRPERAWNPDGDRELDFERDQLLAELRSLGVVPTIQDQYVCP